MPNPRSQSLVAVAVTLDRVFRQRTGSDVFRSPCSPRSGRSAPSPSEAATARLAPSVPSTPSLAHPHSDVYRVAEEIPVVTRRRRTEVHAGADHRPRLCSHASRATPVCSVARRCRCGGWGGVSAGWPEEEDLHTSCRIYLTGRGINARRTARAGGTIRQGAVGVRGFLLPRWALLSCSRQ